MQTAAMRERLFNIRFSDEEWSRLETLKEHLGLDAANLVRMLLKEKARELGIEGAHVQRSATAAKKKRRAAK